jgi:hypothetical protein
LEDVNQGIHENINPSEGHNQQVNIFKDLDLLDVNTDVVQDECNEVQTSLNKNGVNEQDWDGVFCEFTGSRSDFLFIVKFEHSGCFESEQLIHVEDKEVTVINIDVWQFSNKSEDQSKEEEFVVTDR